MKKYKGKKIFALFLAICMVGSCCVPAFAGTGSDDNITLQTDTEEDFSFDQNNILSITCKETTEGEDIFLYQRDSVDSSVNNILSSIKMPIETAEITVEFDQTLQLIGTSSNSIFIVTAENYEKIKDLTQNDAASTGLPYSDLSGEKSNSEDRGYLKIDGTFLDHGETYVMMVNKDVSSSSGSFANADGSKYVELFRFEVETPETIPEGSDENHPIEIDSADDLYGIRNIPHGGQKYYRLTQDIDMNGLTVADTYKYPVGMAFSGVLDGDGHTIKNFTYRSDPVNAEMAGLFETIRHDARDVCCVKNLTFTDVQIGTADDPVTRSAIIAVSGFGRFTFSNVHITTSSEEIENLVYTTATPSSYNEFGCLVGRINTTYYITVEDCTVNNMVVTASGTSLDNDAWGGFFGHARANQYHFPDYDPTLKMTGCEVNDLTFVMSGTGRVGGFAGAGGQLDMSDCTARNIKIECTSGAKCYAGGLFGGTTSNVSNGTQNQITDITLDKIEIVLDGALTTTSLAGGVAGSSTFTRYSDIQMNDIFIHGNEFVNFATGIQMMIGGVTGRLASTTRYSSEFDNIRVSNLNIENIGVTGSQYVSGFVPYIAQTADIDNVYVDCTFTDCSSTETGRFGEIFSNYYNTNFGSGTTTLKVSNTYYNAENGNESNESLGGLFDVTGFGNGVDLSQTENEIAPTIPVTFGIEVVSDEETASDSAGEDVSGDTASGEGTTEGGSGDAGETTEPEVPAIEPMTNRDGATVSVQAYEAVVNENGIPQTDADGNIVKGDKIEGFMDTFGDAVSITGWKTIPYAVDAEGQPSGSTEGITGTNTRVNGVDGSVQADVSSTARVGTEEEPARILVSVMVNGTERTVTIPYRYVRISSGSGGGGGGSQQAAAQEPEITVAGETEGGSTSLSSDGTTLTITPAEGYVISDVTLNGESLGAVSEVTDLETGDEVVVTFAADDPDDTPGDVPQTGFIDVADSAWYKESVDFVVDRGLFNGTGADTFTPQGDMTRAMFVTAVGRLSGETVSGYENPFADVAAGTWYTDSVAWAAAKGIVNGVSETAYAPDQAITREQMAVMLYNYAVYAGVDVSVADGSAVSTMPDASDISSWAEEAMTWAYDRGLMTGTDEGRLEPARISTRAEVATIFERFVRMTETQTEA